MSYMNDAQCKSYISLITSVGFKHRSNSTSHDVYELDNYELRIDAAYAYNGDTDTIELKNIYYSNMRAKSPSKCVLYGVDLNEYSSGWIEMNEQIFREKFKDIIREQTLKSLDI